MDKSRKGILRKTEGYGRTFKFEDAVKGNVFFVREAPEQGMQWREDLIPFDDVHEDVGPAFKNNTLPPYLIKKESKFQRTCMPFEDADLLGKFIRLAKSTTPEEIQKLANRYGFLGHPINLRDSKKKINAILHGESLTYWQLEINRLASLWNRWELVQQENKYALSKHVKWKDEDGFISLEINDGAYDRRTIVRQSDEKIGGELKNETYSKIPFGDVISTMRVCIEERINQHLEGHVHPVIFHFIGKDLHMAPDCLLSGLYLLFAFQVVEYRLGKKPSKACRGCEKHFSPRRLNQQYCTESCKTRTNKRIQRAKLKKNTSRNKA